MVVAMREYVAAVKTKAFIVSMIAVPIIWAGSIAIQVILSDKVDVRDKHVAVLDYTGEIAGSLKQSADERNETEIFSGKGDDKIQDQPRFLVEIVEPDGKDADEASFALSERVRKEELLAYVIIGPDAVTPGDDRIRAGVQYYSNSPTYRDVAHWIRGPIDSRIREIRMASLNLDPEVVAAAIKSVSIADLGLVSRDEAGNVTEAKVTNRLANIFAPMGLMMLMLMSIMVGSQPLMNSVLEEKTLRIAEVLLGSISPFGLMLGKLIGTVGVSLTIATVYLIVAFVGINRAGYGDLFPAHLIWWFAFYDILAVFMFGALFAAVGAAVSDMKEAQSMVMPVMIVIMMPLFVWMHVVQAPSSTLSLVLSLFPPATPMLMLIRMAVPPGIPIWQPLLGGLLVTLTTIATIFAASRVFRVGILMQGKGAKFTELFRWILKG
jgi:ABC-2 type transport system permease protein